jgi:hypothetical protein
LFFEARAGFFGGLGVGSLSSVSNSKSSSITPICHVNARLWELNSKYRSDHRSSLKPVQVSSMAWVWARSPHCRIPSPPRLFAMSMLGSGN